ncbi:ABC transporter permease [Cytobacillus suaedae]|nr:ABC transporter permease [Cytobacillus suaedae]
MKNKELPIGIILLSILLLITFIGPHLPFIDTEFEEGRMRYNSETKEFSRAPHPPSSDDWFGTDEEGRDIFSLIILGAKDTLYFMLAATFIKYLMAVPLGLLARKGKGIIYSFLSTWSSVFSGLPIIIMGIILFKMPIFMTANNRFLLIVFVVSLLEVGRVGMVFQQLAGRISTKPYIEASITMGSKPLQIVWGHYLPVLLPEILVSFILNLGRMALLVGQLGVFKIFLSFQIYVMGTPPLVNTSYNWGSLLGDAKDNILRATWIPLFPALAITYVIFTFNLLGEGLRKKLVRA